MRVSNSSKYNIAPVDLQNLQRVNTELNRAITKLKLKPKKK